MTTQGFVWLVGAGPGDPELLTRKAARVLGDADLVLYDALVVPEALALAPHAQRFRVGKRAGRASVRQETIERLMVQAARRGKRVVRLKCGDPFVLGRGGEEGLALAAAGVPFEVVPGVTSAVAAPALAGIPVTHRGLASGFLVVSGHAESAYGPVLTSLPPQAVTVVVLMGLASRAAIADLLLRRGWPRTTPAAVVLGAATDATHTWLGTLESLAAAPLPGDSDAPGTLVLGPVVSLAAVLAPASSAEPAPAAAARW
ncbi:MAG: uroporphyrinogen-III C-methyltransferase [Acidobacteria bacterium]|nr:uroporphyrinogen-III C-methyltransferase [Acidobacteriota bacterium]